MVDEESQKPEGKKPAGDAPAPEAGPAKREDAPKKEPAPPAPARAEGGEKREGEKVADKNVFVSLGLEPVDEGAAKVIKAKGSKHVHAGIVHVIATFNNTLVTVTDLNGNVIGWSSAGKMGFRGSRKSTAYAAQLVSQDACRQAMGHGLRQAEVRVKGPGGGRESAVRAVQAIGIEISMIKDVTPIPHNGCRPPKARRV